MPTEILVVSDTHGDHKCLEEILELLKSKDMLIHLGDNYEDFLWLKKRVDIKAIGVKGNCDLFSNGKEIELIKVEEVNIMLTHGHDFGVKSGLLNLLYYGLERKAQLILFGHTHIGYNDKYEGVNLFNPGSPVMPRGMSKASYGNVTIEGNKFSCEIKKRKKY
ncbi:metallophosphoesterase [Proteinivorax tanatarense]|uniref:Phosphoesterase n=1 Tax=Proteinivorax tanatarense TaxID=1260629 RepID=A0AAU7VIL8_9FIRM